MLLMDMIQRMLRILIIHGGQHNIRLHTMLMVRRVVKVINAVAVLLVVERGAAPVR